MGPYGVDVSLYPFVMQNHNGHQGGNDANASNYGVNVNTNNVKSEMGSDAMMSNAFDDTFDLQHQEEDTNALMYSLAEMIKRDPTLSSLLTSHELEQHHPYQGVDSLDAHGGGLPIPSRTGRQGNMASATITSGTAANSSLFSSSTPATGSSLPLAGSSHFSGSSGTASTTGGVSPISSSLVSPPLDSYLIFPNPQRGQNSELKMDLDDQMTMPPVHSPEPLLIKEESNNDLDLVMNDFFTNESSKDVSLGLPYNPKANATLQKLKTEQTHLMQQQQQQQHGSPIDIGKTSVAMPQLLFSSAPLNHNTSSGGGIVLSSSVPASSSPFLGGINNAPTSSSTHSSPLGHILCDLNSVSPPPMPRLSPKSPSKNQRPPSTLHKLLLRKEPVTRPSPVRSPEGRKSLVMRSAWLGSSSTASSPGQSANNQTEEGHWNRREPRRHFSSVCSSIGNESSSIADEVSEVLSGMNPNELPDIESDEEDPDSSIDDSSDDEQDTRSQMNIGPIARGRSASMGTTSKPAKKERHFWQYNVQAKGPKGNKIVVETKIEDPHRLNEIVDPVFSGDVQLQGIKHSGKARRGDGNDLTANPKKLAAIGKELEQLNSIINDLTPPTDAPMESRCSSRKEKNKLASRACRLKKKAQHEANKVKCKGLEDEHLELSRSLARAKEILRLKLGSASQESQERLTREMDNVVKSALRSKVAGQTTEFVNRTIERYMKQ